MNIVTIFANRLYAIQFDNESENELARIVNMWKDVEYLFNYFDSNREYFDNSYWNGVTIEYATDKTLELLDDIYDTLIKCAADNTESTLDAIFYPLSDNLNSGQLILGKSKLKKAQNWLRFYALKVEPNVYVITGGAIKLTHKMQDHPDTTQELMKLNKCRDFLIQNGIIDLDGFTENNED
ncbi:MAG: hypothetical protein K9J21_05880 [Bacteroidales bacterium]|nr:hypothetical protein [Bacteroidales bacterium]